MVVITFDSPKFDVEAEPENDINPIQGQSCLAWLRPKLEASGYVVEGPACEDWGWYLDVRDADHRYVLGAMAWPSDGPVVDWWLQVWRRRSFGEWLRGRGHIALEDALIERTVDLLLTEGEARELDRELT